MAGYVMVDDASFHWTVIYEHRGKTEERDLWLNPITLEWPAKISASMVHPAARAMRAYEIFSHAERRLSESGTALDRVDVVASLKRAVAHRLDELERIYNLKAIPVGVKSRWPLEVLAYFGAGRTLMVKELRDIRNAVEHEDAEPPSIDDLYRFLDLVWYFLRSTDRLVVRAVGSLLFEDPLPDGDPDWLELDIEPRGWRIALTGGLKEDLVSEAAVSGWIVIRGTVEAARHDEMHDDSGRVQLLGLVQGPDSAIERAVRLVLGGALE